MSLERYFIIRNDATNYYNISDNDTSAVRSLKEQLQARNFAIYNPVNRHWTMQLPNFFWNSPDPYKSIVIENFQYYKPDGTCDIGTTFHSPTLIDGDFAQFDNMIGIASLSINRVFPISGKQPYLEFYFKDYMSDECLEDGEIVQEQKRNENGELLYYNRLMEETTNENSHPVMIDVKNPVSFIIMAKLIC